MSTRSNPFEEVEQFFERMARQFDESSRTWASDGPLSRSTGESTELAVDIVEHDDEFVVSVDVPGFEKRDIDVRVTDQTLHVEAEHDESIDEEDERYLRQERRHESLRRRIHLPEAVDREHVNARMTNGVLTITIPKAEVREARTIEIE
ncbi:small heat shock protein HSP16.5 [Halolamina pelagica]|uniref:Small heat shock protein HSP16.5 n=1 Tax=Halolamina pelagica TaxID=699431 RepID=A0A0P7GKS2_9EURY|nr:Hsp20/alpha crystallin family protein [Halolamina pelagica]KPN29066.1 small heat shock protein HSP16.5 [Halolamina pelagica]